MTIQNTVNQLEELIARLDAQIAKTGSASLKSARAAAQAELDYWKKCLTSGPKCV